MLLKTRKKDKFLEVVAELIDDVPDRAFIKCGRDIRVNNAGKPDIQYYIFAQEEIRNLDSEDGRK
jgi:hypothetical protein